MREIHIESGEVVQVDDEDYSFLTLCYDFELNAGGYVWCYLKEKYKRKRLGFYSNISLQKLLIAPERKGRNHVVDHKDGDILNNQKSNLRKATHAENMHNRKPQDSVSQYKGVHWLSHIKKWRAIITIDSVVTALGTFSNEEAAANCYNYYANECYGEFARLNEVPYMPKEEWMTYTSASKKTSMYKGVSKVGKNRWLAQIWDGQKNIQIGRFNSEIEAAEAYEEYRIKLGKNKHKVYDQLKYDKEFVS